MNTVRGGAVLLIIALAISIGVNVYQTAQNHNLQKDKEQLESALLLATVQNEVDTKLKQLDSSLINAAIALSTTNLQDTQAHSILTELAASDTLILNAATSNQNDTLLTVVPSSYSNIIGEYVGDQDQTIRMHQTLHPAVGGLIYLVGNFYGVVMVAPVFGANGSFIGAVGIVVQPYQLLDAIISPKVSGTSRSFCVMQTDGLTLYDSSDASQTGKNLFTDQLYAPFTELVSLGHHIANEKTGTGTYSFTNPASGDVVNKQTQWTTVSIYSTDWRVALINIKT